MEDNIFYTTHELKILPKWFDDVVNEVKNFEIRRADRPYRVGDRLLLRECEKGRLTGRKATREIEYIFQGDGAYGLSEEFCILGLKRERKDMKRTTATQNTMLLAAIMLPIIEGWEFENKDMVQGILQEMSREGFVDAEKWKACGQKDAQ